MSHLISAAAALLLTASSPQAAADYSYLTTPQGQVEVYWITPTEVWLAADTVRSANGELPPVPIIDPPIDLDAMPVAKDPIRPAYPEAAEDAELQAQLVLQALIAADGSVRRARIFQGSGYPYDMGFERSALMAVMESSYEPAHRAGLPVEVWVSIPILYQLE